MDTVRILLLEGTNIDMKLIPIMANNQLMVFAVIIGALIICAVQQWILPREFLRTFMLRKEQENSTIANFPRWLVENPSATNKQNTRNRALKVILFYTTWFGKPNWPGIVQGAELTISCGELTCRFTHNQNELQRSDAVMFHGRDLPSETVLKEAEKSKPSNQRWVYHLLESPHNAGRNPALLNGMFNWTMTYRVDSDFFVPYGYYTTLKPNEIDPKPKNYALGKDKLAVWVVSHCGVLRDGFVLKLLKYIKVDIFGACANKFNQRESCPISSPACTEKLQHYKFYLAFENSFCIDYITEKYWRKSLFLNIIPVVMGGASYENEKLAIPGSFINVVDFESVEALANYLIYLNSNDTAYNEYFLWRKRFKLVPMMPSWPCMVCAALNNDSLPAKVYNMEDFWGVEKTCGANEDKVRKLIAEAN
ncbi:PREDICTED: galactoside 3(4)-L-fucosyltransferase-like [Acropora digitifera]|uniref:galactoside 3(4)-L-fucosyltransferase-like n=1 Tax=Acropora digitifera TaxID=70779 RepID=UPI00077A87EF|nr:PREDICTED: galactoside 3(4)-L-fucosyltransferase-like [Acropora digitifera]